MSNSKRSSGDSQVKGTGAEARRPATSTKGRGKHRTRSRNRGYMVPGERAVRELLECAPERVKSLWVEKGRNMDALRKLAQQHDIQVEETTRDRMEEEVGEGLARGVVAHASPPPKLDLAEWVSQIPREAPSIVIALDGVGDPQNFGAILRNAEFFGTDGVLWATDRAAPLSVLAVRASAGASERVSMVEVPKLGAALQFLKDAGYWIVGTVASEEAQPLGEFLRNDPPERLVIVMGNEHQGLRPTTIGSCDFLVMLPRGGALGSLNVSAAMAATLAVCRTLCPSSKTRTQASVTPGLDPTS